MLDDLELFTHIVENGSISKAAASLGILVPTLSRKIQSLEHELGYKLFLHKGNALELTVQGRSLYDLTIPHLNSLSNAIDTANEVREETRGEIKVVIHPILSFMFFTQKLINFTEKYPHLKLSIFPGFYSAQGARNDFDIGLSYFVPENSYLIQKTLLHLNAGIYTTEEYLQNYPSPATLIEAESCKFITQKKLGQDFHQVDLRTDSGVNHIFHLRNSQFILENIFQTLMLMKHGHHLCFLPNIMISVMEEQSNLKLVRLFPEYSTEMLMNVYLIKKSSFDSAKTKLITELINDGLAEFKHKEAE